MIGRALVFSALLGASLIGIYAWRDSVATAADARGAARVQAAWDADEAARNEATARDNAIRFRNAERIADADTQREAARLARDAAADTAVRSLRAEVARLNSSPHSYAPGDAGIASCARESAVARELLGESSGAYQELAAAADGLRDQVTGLQAFVHTVCGAPAVAATEVSDGF